ncbi:MAG: NAD(P)H-dependent glycerol-3-phosphate dehydrogenase [Methanobrevibacter sp.]|uniref:NAD(P)H-dependent glycerol-3-phosphate dehydrogenase n=1 Tax=Methanobrevibacter sp. TaxID=66852 RepID=UPI002600E4A4|nr:NAD(P)H-dependent glycerol-3-phosphate dehydrogenase [Methanobrevibacter sp.]MBE6508521.1 NAD(P)H-dependent glycerol-3-phosphate dehydrogenase [Methanobrevibacter sp.]
MPITVGVIGAGAMGTAVAQTVAPNANVLLYARREEICNDINNTKVNSQYFPNVKLHENITAVCDLNELKDVEIIFLCIPSSVMRELVEKLNNVVNRDCIFVNTAKGLENKTNKTMTDIIEEITERPPVAFSGPNIASEMVKSSPASTTIACVNDNCLNKVKNVLVTDSFKVNANNDVIGTEFCGILKNIVAISQGICEGMNINNNAKFAVFTKSYNETKDIIEKLGGKRDTVDDYCGFGDIVTASTLSVSRNHTLGVLSGQGIVIDEKASGVLFEGKNTATILKNLCDELNINSLTVDFVYDVIINQANPKNAFYRLWEQL